MKFSKGIMAASTRALILSVLKRNKSYGYQISQDIRELSDGQLEWADGMLYPVLRKMEKEGLLISEWVLEENEKRRKYYSITEKGKRALIHDKEQWQFMNKLLLNVWNKSLT